MTDILIKRAFMAIMLCIMLIFSAACGGGIVNFDSEGPQTEVLEITSPNAEEVDIFSVDYRRYIDCKDGTDVRYFCSEGGEIYAPVVIEWKNTYKNVVKFKAEYAASADFSEGIEKTGGKMDDLREG